MFAFIKLFCGHGVGVIIEFFVDKKFICWDELLGFIELDKALPALQPTQIAPLYVKFQEYKLLCVAQVGSAWGIT